MKIQPSAVSGVELYGPSGPEFGVALQSLLGRAPRSLIEPALPFSVIVANNCPLPIAFFAIRFDMLGPRAKPYSVVHYADSLRNPGRADFRPGGRRFVCAEPAYTTLVLRDEVAADTRGRMNLENLRRMIEIKAVLDCVAFDDGCFAGPDSLGALARLRHENTAETELLNAAKVLAEPAKRNELQALLVDAVQDQKERARRSLGRRLLEALETDGVDGVAGCAAAHRFRVPVWRESEGRVAVQTAP